MFQQSGEGFLGLGGDRQGGRADLLGRLQFRDLFDRETESLQDSAGNTAIGLAVLLIVQLNQQNKMKKWRAGPPKGESTVYKERVSSLERNEHPEKVLFNQAQFFYSFNQSYCRLPAKKFLSQANIGQSESSFSFSGFNNFRLTANHFGDFNN